jgi:hypothetical protein
MYVRPTESICLFPYPKCAVSLKPPKKDCPYEQGHSRPLKKHIQKKNAATILGPRVKIRNVVV